MNSINNGDGAALYDIQRTTIDGAMKVYGALSAQQISDVTRQVGGPWEVTRERAGAAPGDRCTADIVDADVEGHFTRVLGV